MARTRPHSKPDTNQLKVINRAEFAQSKLKDKLYLYAVQVAIKEIITEIRVLKFKALVYFLNITSMKINKQTKKILLLSIL